MGLKMYLKYRMNARTIKPSNSKNSNTGGIFSGLFGAVANAAKNVTKKATNVTKKATNAVTGRNNSTKNVVAKASVNIAPEVAPVTAGVNAPVNANTTNATSPLMKGGVAPINYSIPLDQRQPSEDVMRWATTAGMAVPSGSQMRNVARGGKRRTIKRQKGAYRRRSYGGRIHTKYSRKHRNVKHKTHRRRRHHKRSN
jgi:flagellar hook-basal body complex protein FliE